MQRINKRRAAIAAAVALVATSGAAAQAALVPDTSAVRGDAQRIVTNNIKDTGQTAADTRSVAGEVAASLSGLVGMTVRRTTGEASRAVAEVYRAAGVTAFAVVNRAGRVVASSQFLSIATPLAGRWDLGWDTDTGGCATVAMTNSATPRVLRVRQLSPASVRVLERSTGASVRRSGFGVAVVC